MRISDWSSDMCSSDLASILRSFRLLQQMQVHERTFPYGAGHCLPLLLRVTRPDNHLVGRFVITSARTLRRLTPRGDRMPPTRGPALTTTMRVVHRSEERRVGKECVGKCSYRWCRYNNKT